MSGLNGINSNIPYLSTIQHFNENNKNLFEQNQTKDTQHSLGVVYEKSSALNTLPKNAYVTNVSKVEKMKYEMQQKMQSLQQMVRKDLDFQSQQFAIASNDDNIWSKFRKGDVTVNNVAIEEAKKNISEQGYYGIQQTAQRIVDFAKALANNDTSHLELLTNAITQGFSQASQLWGDKLPDISQKTYDEVNKQLQEWGKQSSPNSNNTSIDTQIVNSSNDKKEI